VAPRFARHPQTTPNHDASPRYQRDANPEN
jgi:hypothetical protein